MDEIRAVKGFGNTFLTLLFLYLEIPNLSPPVPHFSRPCLFYAAIAAAATSEGGFYVNNNNVPEGL